MADFDVQALIAERDSQLQALSPDSISLFQDDEIPLGYSLIGRPDSPTVARITELAESFRSEEPAQYYYPPDRYHLTLIGELSPTVEAYDIITSVQNILPEYPLRLDLVRIGSNPHTTALIAAPSNFSIHNLRESLRNRLGEHGTDYTRHRELYEHVGWINFMRYRERPSQKFLDTLFSLKGQGLGTVTLDSIELLLCSSSILEPDKTKLIHTF
jgi:2'-5' RNA ligase